ncbi:MAG: Flp pilus assembly protein CpaB [Candidatus Firestonebacteria bacterium]
MKNKNLIFALAMAGVATLLWFVYLSNKEKEVVSKGTPNKVIVAKKYIQSGATLSNEILKEVEIPEIYIQPGAVRDIKYAEGKITLAEISQGEQILANKITKIADYLSSVVPIGYRAVAISVDSETGLNDMIKVGDYVDVLGTFEETGSKGSYTATILQKVKVLAINDNFNKYPKGKSQFSTKESFGLSTVTLGLEPSEVEVISFAEIKGKLRLSLRNPGEDEIVSMKLTNFSNLLKSTQKEMTKPTGDTPSLEIIRGTEGEKIQIKK